MVAEDARYSIDDLVARTGLNRRTIRYYIQLGLVDRPIGETRAAYYTPQHLSQLVRVTSLSAEGLSLDAIGRLAKSDPAASPRASAAAYSAAVGNVEVRSHLTLAPGVELVVEPGRAGLTPQQLKRLFRDTLALYGRIKNEEGD